MRIYFGVGGPNYTSAFHVIGEMFDRAWEWGGVINPPELGIQTVSVPPDGALIVDFKIEVPGALYFSGLHPVSYGARVGGLPYADGEATTRKFITSTATNSGTGFLI